tara:strand:- start:5413 stop:6966 length:1554 start_codon:yes stop_codon:yes gene_type:complete
MNYAFLDIAHQFQLETIDRFLDLTNSNVVYLNTATENNFHGDYMISSKILSKIKDENKSLVHSKTSDFLFLKNLENLIETPWTISEKDLIKLKPIESMAMRLMDRSSLIPISGFSRRRIYLLLVNHFHFLIDNKQIEGLVVYDTPHSFHSHIFYELCKLKEVKIIKMEYHFLTDYSIMLNQDDWPLIPEDYLKENTLEEIGERIPQELKNSLFENSTYLKSYKKSESKKIIKQSIFSTLKLNIRYLDKCLKNLIMGVFPFLFKKEILHFASLNGLTNRLKYRLILNIQLYKLIKLNVFYNKIANRSIHLNDDYVFVGLHMQPEKTSQPMGGEYDNQLMMIKILSDSVPNGWKVFVKEHPNQFNVKKVPNRHYRDKLFYQCLGKLKNVVIVPLEIDSVDLIRNSKMVATLTGTLGWEAITKNIPALVFGNTYYIACRAAKKITSVESSKKAIQDLLLLKQEEDFKKEIFRYISYYNENNYIVNSANWQSLFKLNSLPYLKQVDNIVDKLVYFHNKNKI